MAEGSEQPSFVADILTNSNNLQARKLYSTGDQWLEDVKWAAGGMFGAGVETVRSLRLMLNQESNRIMHSHSLLFWCFTSAWRWTLMYKPELKQKSIQWPVEVDQCLWRIVHTYPTV